jgi:hypothetical protein
MMFLDGEGNARKLDSDQLIPPATLRSPTVWNAVTAITALPPASRGSRCSESKRRLRSPHSKPLAQDDGREAHRVSVQVKKDRLSVGRDRLQVQRYRLPVERDRLQVERHRLQGRKTRWRASSKSMNSSSSLLSSSAISMRLFIEFASLVSDFDELFSEFAWLVSEFDELFSDLDEPLHRVCLARQRAR